jgi:hypothetical protein
MSQVNVQIPDSLYAAASQLASRDQISLDQFIALALAEKISSLSTEELLASRRQRGDSKKFAEVLAKVPDSPPEAGDEW